MPTRLFVVSRFSKFDAMFSALVLPAASVHVCAALLVRLPAKVTAPEAPRVSAVTLPRCKSRSCAVEVPTTAVAPVSPARKESV